MMKLNSNKANMKIFISNPRERSAYKRKEQTHEFSISTTANRMIYSKCWGKKVSNFYLKLPG